MGEHFSDAFLDDLKARVPITEVVGQFVSWDKAKSGKGDLWACCPFHAEKDPSFHAVDEKGIYKCFSCGANGDHFAFLTDNQQKSFPEAVAFVAELAGVDVPNGAPKPSGGRSEAKGPERGNEPPEDEGAPADAPAGKKTSVKAYDYHDADGNKLYQVVRVQFKLPDGSWQIDPKTGQPKKSFMQRRKDAAGNIVYNLDGIGHTIYRHHLVEIAIAEGKTIFLPEGEKDAETLIANGFEASTNSGGAKNWKPEFAAYFAGADVIIPVDNDEVGRERGENVAKSLKGKAARIRILDLAPHWPGMPNKADVTDWFEQGGTAEQLQQIVDTLPDWSPRPPRSAFGATQLRDVANRRIEYDWLVKGLIERRGVFVVAGEMQSGKSFFVIDLGMKIARGVEYCKKKVCQGLVIHQAGEDGRGVQMRAEGYRRDHGIPSDENVPFLIMPGKVNLLSDESVDAFIAECLAWQEWYGQKLELILIDTFSVATEGLDEINSKDVGLVLGRVNRISDECKSAVGLVHHMNAEGRRVRGHSSLTANVSQVIEIRQMVQFQRNRNLPPEPIKDSEGRIVRKAVLAKNKNGPNRVSWRWVLRQVKLGHDDDGFEITTCVLDEPSSDVSEGETKTGRLSPDQKLVFEALKAALDDSGIEMPKDVRAGPQIKRAVKQRDFVAAVRKVWSFKAPETETEMRNRELQDALKRNVTSLINSGYMGRDNDKGIVWSLGKEHREAAKKDAEPKEPAPLPADVQKELDDGVPF